MKKCWSCLNHPLGKSSKRYIRDEKSVISLKNDSKFLNTFIYKNNNLFGVFLYSVATTRRKKKPQIIKENISVQIENEEGFSHVRNGFLSV